MTLNLRMIRPFILGALATLGACSGVARLYLYEPVKAPLNGGVVTANLYAGSITGEKGTSWTKEGPYVLYLQVILDRDDLPPQTCRVNYRSVTLTEPGGKVVEVDRSQSVGFKLEPIPGTRQKGASHLPRLMPLARLPFQSKLDLAYVDYVITADFTMSGCGAPDGDHQLRQTMKTDYGARPVNELTNRVTFF